MRRCLAVAIALAVAVAPSRAEEKKAGEPGRFGIQADLKAFPQGSAKETFASIFKAIEAKRIDYLLAQLTDPAFVEERVQRLHGGKFESQVAETSAKLDPLSVKQLRRFEEKGQWTEESTRAAVRLKEIADRAVYFRKIGPRWYLENHNKAEPAPK